VLGTLPEISRKKNKGWEGIDIIPGRLLPDGEPLLVAVHEGSPRRIGVFTFPDIEEVTHFKLTGDLKDHMADISDVAVCPKTGHLFMLSDASATLVEVELVKKKKVAPGALLENLELNLLGVTDLEGLEAKEKPEGLCFDPSGDLWLATDGDSHLRQFRLTRDS
jgi:uncharacterized protein YjiK